MKTRILIVEDHADSAEFLQLLLEPEGYIVEVAGTGQQARAMLSSFKPEIILMDLMLPDVEGLDFEEFDAARRRVEWRPSLPIVDRVAAEFR